MWRMKIRKEEDAVSPVIGIILLVALTVVFAAIVAGVVMGISKAPEMKDVGLTVEGYQYLSAHVVTDFPLWEGEGGNNHRATYAGVQVLIYGGADADDITALNVTVIGEATGVVFLGSQKAGNTSKYFITSSNQPYSSVIGIPLYYALVYDSIYPVPAIPQLHSIETKAQMIVTATFTDGTQQVIYKGWHNYGLDGAGDGEGGSATKAGIFGDGATFPNPYTGWEGDIYGRGPYHTFETLIKPISEGGSFGFRQSPNITRT
jgi:hypothetical protein